MLQRWFEETPTQFWDQMSERRDSEDSGISFGRLPYQLWNVSKYGSCADAAITGIMPPPLMELQVLTCIFYFQLMEIFNLIYYLLCFKRIKNNVVVGYNV